MLLTHYRRLITPHTDYRRHVGCSVCVKLRIFADMDRKGKLYFRYGTMGSAKTAILLATAYNFEERGLSFI